MINDFFRWKLAMSNRLTANGGRHNETLCGIHVHALTTGFNNNGHMVLDGGYSDYLLMETRDLSSEKIHDIFETLPEKTRAILALPPEPQESQYRMEIIPAEHKKNFKPVYNKLWLRVPTLPSTVYDFPVPFYLDCGHKLYRVDGKDEGKRGKTWFSCVEGRHYNLRGWTVGPMNVETKLEHGICQSCYMGIDFNGCDHIVGSLAVTNEKT